MWRSRGKSVREKKAPTVANQEGTKAPLGSSSSIREAQHQPRKRAVTVVTNNNTQRDKPDSTRSGIVPSLRQTNKVEPNKMEVVAAAGNCHQDPKQANGSFVLSEKDHNSKLTTTSSSTSSNTGRRSREPFTINDDLRIPHKVISAMMIWQPVGKSKGLGGFASNESPDSEEHFRPHRVEHAVDKMDLTLTVVFLSNFGGPVALALAFYRSLCVHWVDIGETFRPRLRLTSAFGVSGRENSSDRQVGSVSEDQDRNKKVQPRGYGFTGRNEFIKLCDEEIGEERGDIVNHYLMSTSITDELHHATPLTRQSCIDGGLGDVSHFPIGLWSKSVYHVQAGENYPEEDQFLFDAMRDKEDGVNRCHKIKFNDPANGRQGTINPAFVHFLVLQNQVDAIQALFDRFGQRSVLDSQWGKGNSREYSFAHLLLEKAVICAEGQMLEFTFSRIRDLLQVEPPYTHTELRTCIRVLGTVLKSCVQNYRSLLTMSTSHRHNKKHDQVTVRRVEASRQLIYAFWCLHSAFISEDASKRKMIDSDIEEELLKYDQLAHTQSTTYHYSHQMNTNPLSKKGNISACTPESFLDLEPDHPTTKDLKSLHQTFVLKDCREVFEDLIESEPMDEADGSPVRQIGHFKELFSPKTASYDLDYAIERRQRDLQNYSGAGRAKRILVRYPFPDLSPLTYGKPGRSQSGLATAFEARRLDLLKYFYLQALGARWWTILQILEKPDDDESEQKGASIAFMKTMADRLKSIIGSQNQTKAFSSPKCFAFLVEKGAFYDNFNDHLGSGENQLNRCMNQITSLKRPIAAQNGVLGSSTNSTNLAEMNRALKCLEALLDTLKKIACGTENPDAKRKRFLGMFGRSIEAAQQKAKVAQSRAGGSSEKDLLDDSRIGRRSDRFTDFDDLDRTIPACIFWNLPLAQEFLKLGANPDVPGTYIASQWNSAKLTLTPLQALICREKYQRGDLNLGTMDRIPQEEKQKGCSCPCFHQMLNKTAPAALRLGGTSGDSGSVAVTSSSSGPSAVTIIGNLHDPAHVKAVKLLLKYNCSIETSLDWEDLKKRGQFIWSSTCDYEMPPIVTALRYGDLKLAKTLLEYRERQLTNLAASHQLTFSSSSQHDDRIITANLTRQKQAKKRLALPAIPDILKLVSNSDTKKLVREFLEDAQMKYTDIFTVY